ncbi:hypothetical protein H0I39_02245 [Ottowia beijingensis]|uniref:Uncharacterized protein n=1 Tax=Ottowia beijingensis TaxID=1207057 RepID=A0A853IWC2_9BURK|nr:hypothetical protein [Ottowia beijingensis]NZA00898.1 hypothetical protein [Ottowia beijingensis]
MRAVVSRSSWPEFVHRVAAGVVRQAADHQRHRQHHQHVGQGEQLAQ